MLTMLVRKDKWDDWDDDEDVDFNAKTYAIQLVTHLNGVREEYAFTSFTFARGFDNAVINMVEPIVGVMAVAVVLATW